jgi:hypothetical protein
VANLGDMANFGERVVLLIINELRVVGVEGLEPSTR